MGKVFKKHGLKCKSFDLEPLAGNVEKQDFLSSSSMENMFIIGNPPFSMVEQFVDHALKLTDVCYFLGGSNLLTGKLSSKVFLLQRFEGYEGNQKDKRSKLDFIDTNGKLVKIWCCGALFDNSSHNKFVKVNQMEDDCFRVGVYEYCKEDNRVKVIRK